MKTVIGVFSDKFRAEAAMDILETKGYETRDLSVIVKDGVRYTEQAGVKGGTVAAALGITGAAATAVSAATTGALAGGLLGGLIAIGIPDKEAKIYEQR